MLMTDFVNFNTNDAAGVRRGIEQNPAGRQ